MHPSIHSNLLSNHTNTPIKTMKHLAAYLLLTLGENIEPGADDIREVLASVGIEADEVRLAQLLNELRGKDIHEVNSLPESSSE